MTHIENPLNLFKIELLNKTTEEILAYG